MTQRFRLCDIHLEMPVLCKKISGQAAGSVIPEKLGKKALSFLQYLIVNHGRNISAEELIEQFWPETDSSNPANSLKNNIKVQGLVITP